MTRPTTRSVGFYTDVDGSTICIFCAEANGFDALMRHPTPNRNTSVQMECAYCGDIFASGRWRDPNDPTASEGMEPRTTARRGSTGKHDYDTLFNGETHILRKREGGWDPKDAQSVVSQRIRRAAQNRGQEVMVQPLLDGSIEIKAVKR